MCFSTVEMIHYGFYEQSSILPISCHTDPVHTNTKTLSIHHTSVHILQKLLCVGFAYTGIALYIQCTHAKIYIIVLLSGTLKSMNGVLGHGSAL